MPTAPPPRRIGWVALLAPTLAFALTAGCTALPAPANALPQDVVDAEEIRAEWEAGKAAGGEAISALVRMPKGTSEADLYQAVDAGLKAKLRKKGAQCAVGIGYFADCGLVNCTASGGGMAVQSWPGTPVSGVCVDANP